MHKYIVDSVKQITATTLLLNLKEQEGQRLFSFQPGQYAAISFYRRHRPTPARCFSIVSSPTEQETLQFSMRTRGRFTSAVSRLQPGSIVNVRGPYGGFVLDLARDGEAILLAGGIGITPFMSMLSYATSIRSKRKITLFFSCQTQDDIPFLSELTALTHENENLKVVLVVGRGAVDALTSTRGMLVETGQVTPDLLDKVLGQTYRGMTFYTCGPPPYMNAMIKTLRKKGVARHHILTEAFAQGSHPQTGRMQSWPYNIYVLGAAGVVLGSLAVAIGDILKTLPPETLISSANLAPALTSTNTRQQDLDALVNGLPALASSAPESAAAQAAIAATIAAQNAPPPAPIPTPIIVRQAPPVAPAPVQKTCTTTQSGVTTCV